MTAGAPGPLAISEAIARARPGLLRFALSLVRDPARAEDLAQEAVTRGLEQADSFRGEASVATWLHRIAYRLAVDHARRDREIPVEDMASLVEAQWRRDTYTVDAEEVVARAETRSELEDALIRLPVIYRVLVVLHDAERLTVAEIADLLQIGLPAAKQRLRRGRMMLVSALASSAERQIATQGVPMRCWDARRHVSDYLDGVLEAGQAERVEAHLADCPTCPPLYVSLVGATDALVRASHLRDPDSVVQPEVVERIRTARSASRGLGERTR